MQGILSWKLIIPVLINTIVLGTRGILPAEVAVEKNFHAVLQCRVMRVIRWSFSGKDWPPNAQVVGANFMLVLISHAEMHNSGNYTCLGTLPGSGRQQEVMATVEVRIIGE